MNRFFTWLAALRAYLIATAVLDLLWETAHLPLYGIWRTGTMPDKVFAVLHRTMDDVLIALGSLTAALVIAGYRGWSDQRYARVGVAALGIGLAYTVWSEYRDVELVQNWTYSALMPRLPQFGTGLSPILQWIVVPIAALVGARKAAYSAPSIKNAGVKT
jgi:hypothetical protein